MAKVKLPLPEHYQSRQLARLSRSAPFVMRFTRWKGYSGPVLEIKERIAPESSNQDNSQGKTKPRGHLYGEALRQCLPVLKRMVDHVSDDGGVPLELARYMTVEGLKLDDINLPLDREAGAKAALFFRLQTNIQIADRIELLGRRIETFSREEAGYWLAWVTTPNKDDARWAMKGLRITLAGDSKDPAIARKLARLRAR